MRSRLTLHRPAAVMAAVALAAGLAGCGGGSDDDGGEGGGSDTAAYASTWNDVCTSLTTAQTTFQADATKAQQGIEKPSERALAKAVAEPTTKAIGAMSAALEKVQGLEAPGDFAAFQTQVDKAAPATLAVFRDLKEPLATGDIEAFQSAIGRLDPKNVFPALPDELKKQAAACNQF